MNATVYGLAAFIITQPADRVIAGQASWNACAVGDYAREVHGHTIPHPRAAYDYSNVHADPVLKALTVDAGSDNQHTIERYGCRELNEPSLMDLLSEVDSRVLTYGDLRRSLGDAIYVSPT